MAWLWPRPAADGQQYESDPGIVAGTRAAVSMFCSHDGYFRYNRFGGMDADLATFMRTRAGVIAGATLFAFDTGMPIGDQALQQEACLAGL